MRGKWGVIVDEYWFYFWGDKDGLKLDRGDGGIILLIYENYWFVYLNCMYVNFILSY